MRLVFSFLGVLLAGCATPLQGSDDVIMTSNIDQVKGCKLIRQVDGDQMLFSGVIGRDDVRRRLRNAAIQSGATHVLIVSQPNIMSPIATGTGELYRCG